MRFRVDGGMCYNRMAVRHAGKQEMAPGEVWGADVAGSQGTGTNAEPAGDEKPFASDGTPPLAQGKAEDASRYCPVCSQRLESRRCKLICNTCGYYMSCADYY